MGAVMFKGRGKGAHIKPHIPPAAAVHKNIRSLPPQTACNAVYAALADRIDITPIELERLAQRLSRLAWEKDRL